MDDSRETSSLNSIKFLRNSLYQDFKNYVLTKEQLWENGFPKESPNNPVRAVFKYKKVEKGSTERRCCRCASTFHVLSNGQYKAMETCHYHLKKHQPSNGSYPCCNGSYMSKGCMTSQYHVTQQSFLDDVTFVKTKHKKYLTKLEAQIVYALDCEMIYTTAGMEVAKVGIVGVDGLTIFESFVLPQNPILDYNTMYSGITEIDLKGVSVTLVDVQTYLLKLLNKDSILVGHGLENDLKALRLIHDQVVDTSVVFLYEHKRRHKRSLKNIAQEFLDKEIQQHADGHNCIEDALTCMDIMLHKISTDLNDGPPTHNKNKNSISENRNQRLDFISNNYPLYTSLSYNCSTYSNWISC